MTRVHRLVRYLSDEDRNAARDTFHSLALHTVDDVFGVVNRIERVASLDEELYKDKALADGLEKLREAAFDLSSALHQSWAKLHEE